jgi:hypothetical protein
MTSIFKLLGVLLALYVARALVSREVFAKSGIWGRTYYRGQDRVNYWGAIIVYSLLSLALLFMF